MATFTTVDTIRKENLSGTYDYYLMHAEAEDIWKVMCFEYFGQEDDMEFQWEVMGKVVGYKDNDLNREIREPFTEATAREEFERWR